MPEVDAIFENVHRVNQEADQNPECLRISIDTKATVKIGELSRNGKTRQSEALEALDHDMHWETQLIPFGILSVVSGWLTIVFCQSKETSDFIADALLLWW
ncbi:ISAzo13 family transposase, partial [Deltaproteobacteria bacterium TL4]